MSSTRTCRPHRPRHRQHILGADSLWDRTVYVGRRPARSPSARIATASSARSSRSRSAARFWNPVNKELRHESLPPRRRGRGPGRRDARRRPDPGRRRGVRSLELQGGGRVTVRHGATQSVTLVRGNSRRRASPSGATASSRSTPACAAVRTMSSRSRSSHRCWKASASRGAARSGRGRVPRPRCAGARHQRRRRDRHARDPRGQRRRRHQRRRLDPRSCPRPAGGRIDGGGEIRYLGAPTVTSGIDGGGSIRPIEAR